MLSRNGDCTLKATFVHSLNDDCTLKATACHSPLSQQCRQMIVVWTQMWMRWSPLMSPPVQLICKQWTSLILVQTLRPPVMVRFLRVLTLSVFLAALHRRTTCPTGARFADKHCDLMFIIGSDVSCRCGSVTLKEAFILNSGAILWNSSFWIQSKRCMSVAGARTCWHARATRSYFPACRNHALRFFDLIELLVELRYEECCQEVP